MTENFHLAMGIIRLKAYSDMTVVIKKIFVTIKNNNIQLPPKNILNTETSVLMQVFSHLSEAGAKSLLKLAKMQFGPSKLGNLMQLTILN